MASFRHQWRVILIGLGLFLTSCSPFSSKKSPVILIMIESFSEQDFLCGDSRRLDGLSHLSAVCDEFVRFTHTYAPTQSTQANLVSILSGLDLAEHGVGHNGPVGLPGRFQTLAERALDVKMKTAFFSGGVPVLHKFGVGQGYEEFNEPFWGGQSQFFRPFRESVNRAMRWMREQVGSRSFFLTLYVPDLLHRNRVLQDSLDNERPIGRTSEVQEVYETLDDFLGDLKNINRLKNSHLVVVGLGGAIRRMSTPNPLSSPFFHVPLQIKLARDVSSNLDELKSDMVSFSKLGRWLAQLIAHKPSQGDLMFPPDREERWLPQQNLKMSWLNIASRGTFGLRRKQYLFVNHQPIRVYDSYNDKDEVEPLKTEEAQLLTEKFDIHEKMKAHFSTTCVSTSCDPILVDKKTLRQLSKLVKNSSDETESQEFFSKLEKRVHTLDASRNSVTLSWMAQRSLYLKRWTTLFELGQKASRRDWMLLSQLNLRDSISSNETGCLKFFVSEVKKMSSFYQHCQDSGLRQVVDGLAVLKNRQRPAEGFWAQVDQIKSRREALRLNLDMLFINDLLHPFDFAPSLSELYFFLPENREFLNLIEVDNA